MYYFFVLFGRNDNFDHNDSSFESSDDGRVNKKMRFFNLLLLY